MLSFHQKVAVITGAGSGIGQALAVALARQGAQLALSDINLGNVATTAQQCQSLGTRVKHYQLDVGSRDAIYAHAAEVVKDFGTVNLIINNAGVAVNATVKEMSDDDFYWLMDINFWGMVHGTRAFLPHVLASGDGHIVNISSIFGMVGVPKQSAYNASKFAIRGFTEALRQELLLEKAKVGVSCVHPGGVKTNIARDARKGASDAHRDIATPFEKFAKTTPEKAAEVILKGVKKNRGRIFVGRDARVLDFLQRFLGLGYEKIVTPQYVKRLEEK
ncbi:MAG TPA: SDR family oxidoreductase [Gemmatales bacterium]|nr:SDR family oxidoreductase [Gemmatales bacterium]